jgi:SAM-dependent methyltransferase
MNRDRRLIGSNSYERELGLDPLAYLGQRSKPRETAWLDLCCGSGRALVEAAGELQNLGYLNGFYIDGIDLAGLFNENPFPHNLTLTKSAIEAWIPQRRYSLITCVHGLHYIGDKLGILAMAAGTLTEDGLLIANLDLASFRSPTGKSLARRVAAALRSNGFEYNSRRRLIQCLGRQEVAFKLTYLGADDSLGPNYTGQPAVVSYYGH